MLPCDPSGSRLIRGNSAGSLGMIGVVMLGLRNQLRDLPLSRTTWGELLMPAVTTLAGLLLILVWMQTGATQRSAALSIRGGAWGYPWHERHRDRWQPAAAAHPFRLTGPQLLHPHHKQPFLHDFAFADLGFRQQTDRSQLPKRVIDQGINEFRFGKSSLLGYY